MANLDHSTPQLKVARNWLDAYSSLDASKLDPLLSKHYKHLSFPESIRPEETKQAHIKRYGELASSLTKVHEVIDAPGKVILHVRPSTPNRHVISGYNTNHDAVHSCMLCPRYDVQLQ
jgi:hypothetical protein